MKYTIHDRYDGIQLREYLHTELVLSRRIITKLKKLPEGIMLNGEAVTVRAVLHTGDTLELALDDSEADINPNIVASEELLLRIKNRIMYEDSDIIAVNKPENMPTHPSHGHFEDSLANGIIGYYAGRGVPFVFRAVNRLDRDTSGIVVIAKNQLAAKRMSELIQSGAVRKSYIAVLRGALDTEKDRRGFGLSGKITQPDKCTTQTPDESCMKPGDSGKTPPGIYALDNAVYEIKTRFHRQSESIITREVTFDTDGVENSEAHTRFRVLFREPRFTVVAAEPVTGRTHQLRVHFAYLGHNIIGDTLYGSDEEYEEDAESGRITMKRQALHAYKLVFPHPGNGKMLTISAPLPDDMKWIENHTGERPLL